MAGMMRLLRGYWERGVWSHPALWPRLRAQLRHLPLVAILGFTASGLEGVGIGLFIPLITEGGQLPAWAHPWLAWLPRAEHQPLLASSALLLTLVSLRATLQLTSERIIARVHAQTAHDARMALVEVLLRRPYAFFLGHDPNRLLALIHSESFRLADMVLLVLRFATAICAAAALLVLLFFFGHGLIWPVVAGVLLLRVLQRQLEVRLQRLSSAATRESRLVLSRASTIALAARTWMLFGQAEAEGRRFERQSERLSVAQRTLQQMRLWATPLHEVGAALLFLVVARLASRQQLTAATLVTFLALLYRLQPYLRNAQMSLTTIASLRGSIEEMTWLLSQPDGPERELPANASGASRFGDIVFDSVWYSYPASTPSMPERAPKPEVADGAGGSGLEPVLAQATFRIPQGQATALLGHSGTGKSTLVQLLTGLVAPDRGTIRVGDVPLSLWSPAHWRRCVAVAGQDVELVDGTVAHNIAYGCGPLSPAALEAAARAADAHGFIETLPAGYGTVVGSQGRALSVGQRQRIGLARALARILHPSSEEDGQTQVELLVLDEATSAVDGPSEQAIVAMLEGLPVTKLVIGHRPAVVAHCTWAVVLAGGRVIEEGPLRDCRYYNEMQGL